METEEAEQRTVAPEHRDADPEVRERAELRKKVRMSNYIIAAVEQRAAVGPEQEYNAAIGISGNRFPLELLAPPEARAAPEARATTDADIATTPRRWIDRLFAETAAMRLGITMESVPVGSASYPVTTAGASAAQRQRSTDAAADAVWTIGVDRIEAQTQRRPAAVLALRTRQRIPGLESALTRDLRMALTEGIDARDLPRRCNRQRHRCRYRWPQHRNRRHRGRADADQQTSVACHRLRSFMDMIDGLHASTPGRPARSLQSVGASRLWHSTNANTNRNESVAQIMMGNGINFMAREGISEDHDEQPSSAAFIGRNRGIDGAGVAGIWDAGELIRDPYSAVPQKARSR